MKTVIALSLCGLCLAACDRQKSNQQEPVDEQTRTTSAIIVEPTLHDGHAAQPAGTPNEEQQEQTEPQNYEPNPPPMDRVDQEPVQEARDGG